MSRFVTALQSKPSARDGFFLLTAPLVYDSDAAGLRITIETDFETNFVTGRKLLFVRRIVVPEMDPGSVVHDKLYDTGMVSRALADAVFREAMLVCGVSSWRAWAAWAAVRSVGWRFYKKATGAGTRVGGEILRMASAGPDDHSPMQFVSAQLLEQYRAQAAELDALRQTVAVSTDAAQAEPAAHAGPTLG